MAGMTDITRHGNNKKERMISGVGVKEDALVDFGNQEQVYVDDTDDFDTYTKGPGLISKVTKAGIALCLFPVLLLKNLPKLFGQLRFLPGLFKKIVPGIKKLPAFCAWILKYTGIPWLIRKGTGFLAARKEKSKLRSEERKQEQFIPLSQAVASRDQDKSVDTVEFSQEARKQSPAPQAAVAKKSSPKAAPPSDGEGEDPFAEPPRWSMKKRLTFAVACSILMCVCYVTGKSLLHSNASETVNEELAANLEESDPLYERNGEDPYLQPSNNTAYSSANAVPPPPPVGLSRNNDSSLDSSPGFGFSADALPQPPVQNHFAASEPAFPPPAMPYGENYDETEEYSFTPSPLPSSFPNAQEIRTQVHENPLDIAETRAPLPSLPATSNDSLSAAPMIATTILPSSPSADVLPVVPLAQNPKPRASTYVPEEGLAIPDQSAPSLFATTASASSPSRSGHLENNPPQTSPGTSSGLFGSVSQNASGNISRAGQPSMTDEPQPIASPIQESYAQQPRRRNMEMEAPLVIPDAAPLTAPSGNDSLFAAASPVANPVANHYADSHASPRSSLQDNRSTSATSASQSLFQQVSPAPTMEAMEVVDSVLPASRLMMEESVPAARASARSSAAPYLQASGMQERSVFSEAITTATTQPSQETPPNYRNAEQSIKDIPLTSPIEEGEYVLSPSQINGLATQSAPIGESYSSRVSPNLPDQERVARIRERLRSLRGSGNSDNTEHRATGATPSLSSRNAYQGETRGYLVQEGDKWWTIAKRELNEVGRWREIRDLNQEQVRQAQGLFPGMEIQIPVD